MPVWARVRTVATANFVWSLIIDAIAHRGQVSHHQAAGQTQLEQRASSTALALRKEPEPEPGWTGTSTKSQLKDTE